MCRKGLVSAISAIVMTFLVSSAKTHKVTASYTYYSSPSESIEQAKKTALERAKIEAIAEKFGTVVSQKTSSVIGNSNGNDYSRFHSVMETDVRGEWIETVSEPEYNISYVDNTLVVEVTVSGKVSEIRPNGIDFISKTLKNGTELKFEDTVFADGDDLFLYFRTPVKGFVAAYLLDEQASECYCLLPYKNQDGMPVAVKKDTDYVFFSPEKADGNSKELVDEYILTAADQTEYNTVYVIFSPDEFSRPSGNGGQDEKMPVATPHRDFLKWLSKLRSKNKNINCITIPVEIHPSNQ